MKPATVSLLRVSGLLCELVFATLLVATRGKNLSLAGLPLERWLVGGLIAGFVVWLASRILAVGLPRPRRQPPPGAGWLAGTSPIRPNDSRTEDS